MKNGQSDAGVVNEASAVILAEVTRGKLVESVHRGSVVVAEVNGQFAAAAGDPERIIFFRSSAKPFQAIPLIASGAADAFDFSTEELALACSSHDATPMHQRGVVRMLAKIGLDDDALRCGISPPADEEEAARITLGLKARSQIQCECSGEHAGMLAACRHLGYSLDDYVAPDHPVQQHIRTIVARVTPGAVQVSPKRGHPQHRHPGALSLIVHVISGAVRLRKVTYRSSACARVAGMQAANSRSRAATSRRRRPGHRVHCSTGSDSTTGQQPAIAPACAPWR